MFNSIYKNIIDYGKYLFNSCKIILKFIPVKPMEAR